MALVAYFILTVPASLILCFYFGFDVTGLWIALALGSSFQAILFAKIALCDTDWY